MKLFNRKKLQNKEKLELKPEMVNSFYNYGFIEPLKQVPSYPWFINSFSGDVPSVKKFWESRPALELSLKRVFTANSDAEFEKLYNDFLDLAISNGANDKTLEEMNAKFEEFNVGNMEILRASNK